MYFNSLRYFNALKCGYCGDCIYVYYIQNANCKSNARLMIDKKKLVYQQQCSKIEDSQENSFALNFDPFIKTSGTLFVPMQAKFLNQLLSITFLRHKKSVLLSPFARQESDEALPNHSF